MARSRLGRLIGELRLAPSRADAEAALTRLRVARDGPSGAVTIGAPSGDGDLGSLRDDEADVVRIPRGVYVALPTAEVRVRLLELARRTSRGSVEVHVPIVDDGTHVSRALVDAPRRLLRLVKAPVPEPGSRIESGFDSGATTVTRCFFDDEALLREFAAAGLEVTRRDGFDFVLGRASAGAALREAADSSAIEAARVVPLLRVVDRARRSESPERALAAMRAHGAAQTKRGPVGRARLRRAIGWLDAMLPGGPSCYRRILLEVALDGGAARETVVFGLDVGSTGHVAFEGREERSFDVAFAIPAREP